MSTTLQVPAKHQVATLAVGVRARGRVSRTGLIFLGVGAALVGFDWLTDAIRIDGERAVYTVECVSGKWEGSRCYGRMIAGHTYQFRAQAAKREVYFWTADAAGPAGKYSECRVVDSGNWSCAPNPQTPRTIAHEMISNHPVPDPELPTLPFHEIQKWRWVLLRAGVPVGHEALD
jgi:hypothetical protein